MPLDDAVAVLVSQTAGQKHQKIFEHFRRRGGLTSRTKANYKPGGADAEIAVEYAYTHHIDRIIISGMSSDRRKFVALLESHGPALLAMIRRLCRNLHDADDVYQDTAIRVWRHFASRPRLRNPKAWLMTIGYRAFVDHHERRRPHEPFIELADPRPDEPAQSAEKSESSRRLEAAVETLASPLRQVIVLHYTGGLTLRQTAEAMGISVGTVKSRLNAGLLELRSTLR